jgi:SAM-dependent methyltransferase
MIARPDGLESHVLWNSSLRGNKSLSSASRHKIFLQPGLLFMSFQEARCPACSNGSHTSKIETFGRFAWLRCSECTLEFCDPLEYDRKNYDRAYRDGGVDYYVPSTDWLKQAGSELPEAKWMLSSAQAEALAWIESHYPAASILDIGCGPGWFLARARQRGFQMMGVEVGSAPVRLLRERGFRVECGSVEAVPEGWKPEVVTLFEVLEHLPDPVAVLSQIRERFPNACFILSVPSPRRWTKLGNHRDVADYPPNHLTRWNPDSLRRTLCAAGYSNVEVSYSSPSALETASVSARGLLRSWLDRMPDTLPQALRGGGPRPLREEIAVRRLKYLPGLLFSAGFRFAGWSGISMLAIAWH